MKLYTEIIEKGVDECTMSAAELNEFTKKTKNRLPKDVELALQYLNNYGICESAVVEHIIRASKSECAVIAESLKGATTESVQDMKKILRGLKENIKMLPMFMTTEERKGVMEGQRDAEDTTLDLESEKGRNECAKKYAKLCTKVASYYRGKSGLDWNGLISAAQVGLVKAMNDYHKPDDYIDADTDIAPVDRPEGKKAKGMSFENYAYWRIRNQILNDINQYSRTVKISQYQFDKNTASGNTKGNFNTIRPDLAGMDDEGVTGWDRLNTADLSEPNKKFVEEWQVIYDFIDKNIPSRKAHMFYMAFGLKGYKQQTNQEIAKMFGLSSARITYALREIFQALKSNRDTREAIRNIRDIYNESLIANNYNLSKEDLMEVLINDDIYIMLNEMTRWDNKRVFNNVMGATLEDFSGHDSDFLMECMYQPFDFIDENYTSHRRLYINFLEHLYPTECIKKKTDIDILNRMGEISDMFKKHNLSD